MSARHLRFSATSGRTLTLILLFFLAQYSYAEAATLFAQSDLRVIEEYTDPSNLYSLWLLERPPFQFDSLSPLAPAAAPSPLSLNELSLFSIGKGGAPTTQEWETLWAFWDTITLGMVSEKMLHQKPIDLRHKSEFRFSWLFSR